MSEALREIRGDERRFVGRSLGSLSTDAQIAAVIRPPLAQTVTGAINDLDWLVPVVRRILELAHLRKDWDKRGSASVPVDTLVFVLVILEQIMPPDARAPSIVPLGHGGIQLLWHSSEAELEVEVVKPNELIAFYRDQHRDHEEEWPLSTDLSALEKIVRRDFRR